MKLNKRDKKVRLLNSFGVWFLPLILLLTLFWLLWTLSFLFDESSIKTSRLNYSNNNNNNNNNNNKDISTIAQDTQHGQHASTDIKLRHSTYSTNSDIPVSNQLPVLRANSSGSSSSNRSVKKSILKTLHELFNVGVSNPKRLVDLLENRDPLNVSGYADNFTCANDSRDRIDSPKMYNDQAMKDFRAQSPTSFIFYQHLRKAGGTAFCSAAQQNMERRAVPSYYCMPDNRGSLATPPWNNAEFLLRSIREQGYRIVANEWDAFYESFFDLPGAVFATTFRHPIDRWYSQYRFEHLEHRDGSSPGSPRAPMLQWYNNQKGWTMGTNYYVNTFVGEEDSPAPTTRTGDFYWTYHKFQHKKIDFTAFNKAVQNLRKFHLVLITEWLERSAPIMNAGLGWRDAPKQVLPHEVQAPRKNKANIPSRKLLSASDYDTLAQENVFDLLLFAVAKRIFLERSKCYT